MLGIENRKLECKSYHVTTNVTNTPWAGSVGLLSLVICTTGAGTTWVITVKSKEATPKIIYQATVAAGTVVPIALTDAGFIEMIGGIDIVTSGATPGVLDVWATVLRLDHD